MAFLRRAAGVFTGILSFLYMTFILNGIQMLSVVVYPFSRTAFRSVNRWCARSIWGLWVVMAELQHGIHMRFTGDRVPRRENALLLPNHQGMADVMVLVSFAWRCSRVGDLKWFVKDIIKYFPGFGWGMRFLDCIFVKRNWAQDADGIQHLFGKYKAEQIPIFLVSFLEGTRKTEAKLQRAQTFAKERGYPIPEHTLVPRTKGFVATMVGLRDHLDAVYDLTIGYPGFTPTAVDCFQSKVSRVEIHVRRYPVSSLPKDEEGLAKWALERFQEKDQLLSQFAKDQRFPGAEYPDQVRLLDWFRPERRVGAGTAG